MMTQTYLADLFEVSERKLERDRHEGTGIPFVKIGRRVLYRREDVLEYLKANRFTSTAEAPRSERAQAFRMFRRPLRPSNRGSCIPLRRAVWPCC